MRLNKYQQWIICFTSILLSIIAFSAYTISQTKNSSGESLIVLDREKNLVVFYSIEKKTSVGILPVDDGPAQIAVTPDQKTAVVSHYGMYDFGSTLSIIDIPSMTLTRTIELGATSRPYGVAFQADGIHVAVTLEFRNSVAIVNVLTGELISEIQLDLDFPRLIAINQAKNEAYVTSTGEGALAIIDLEQRKQVNSVQTGEGAEDVAISPDGTEIWVTNRSDETITVISTDHYKQEKSFECKSQPIRVLFDGDANRAFISCVGSGEISIYDIKRKKEKGFIVLDQAEFPYTKTHEIIQTSSGGIVSFSDSAEVIEFRQNRVEKGLSPRPTEIALGREGTLLMVASRNDRAVYLFDRGKRDYWNVREKIRFEGQPAGIVYIGK